MKLIIRYIMAYLWQLSVLQRLEQFVLQELVKDLGHHFALYEITIWGVGIEDVDT